MPSIDAKVKKLLFRIACTYKYLKRMELCAELEALVKEHQPERYDAISLQLQRNHDRYLKTFGDATERLPKNVPCTAA